MYKSNLIKCRFLRRRENRNTQRKTSQSREENQLTQPTYDTEVGNRTRATLVGVECSHHYATIVLSLNHNYYYFRENKCIPSYCNRAFNTKYRKKYIPNSSILENPHWVLYGQWVVARVIVIKYVIGGLSWVHLIWLSDVTVRLQPTVRFQPYKIISENIAVNAPIKFEKIVISMVMIKRETAGNSF